MEKYQRKKVEGSWRDKKEANSAAFWSKANHKYVIKYLRNVNQLLQK